MVPEEVKEALTSAVAAFERRSAIEQVQLGPSIKNSLDETDAWTDKDWRGRWDTHANLLRRVSAARSRAMTITGRNASGGRVAPPPPPPPSFAGEVLDEFMARLRSLGREVLVVGVVIGAAVFYFKVVRK